MVKRFKGLIALILVAAMAVCASPVTEGAAKEYDLPWLEEQRYDPPVSGDTIFSNDKYYLSVQIVFDNDRENPFYLPQSDYSVYNGSSIVSKEDGNVTYYSNAKYEVPASYFNDGKCYFFCSSEIINNNNNYCQLRLDYNSNLYYIKYNVNCDAVKLNNESEMQKFNLDTDYFYSQLINPSDIYSWNTSSLTFTGWNTKQDGTGTSMSPYDDSGKFNNTTFGLSSVTGAGTVVNLYGQWQDKPYTVNYMSSEDDPETSAYAKIYETGKTYSLWDNKNEDGTDHFTKTGYKLDGWKAKYLPEIDAGLGVAYNPYIYKKFLFSDSPAFYDMWNPYVGKEYEQNYDLEYSLNNPVNAYAIWSPISYTVAYDTNGGNGTIDSLTEKYDAEFTISNNTSDSGTDLLSRAGYTLLGFSTNKNITPAAFNTATENAAKGDTEEGCYIFGQSVKSLSSKDGDTVTLYAVWELINYTVNYDANGGSGEIPSEHHDYDTSFSLPTAKDESGNLILTNGNKMFNGWRLYLTSVHSDVAGNYKDYAAGSQFTLANSGDVDIDKAADSDHMINMYAQWATPTPTQAPVVLVPTAAPAVPTPVTTTVTSQAVTTVSTTQTVTIAGTTVSSTTTTTAQKTTPEVTTTTTTSAVITPEVTTTTTTAAVIPAKEVKTPKEEIETPDDTTPLGYYSNPGDEPAQITIDIPDEYKDKEFDYYLVNTHGDKIYPDKNSDGKLTFTVGSKDEFLLVLDDPNPLGIVDPADNLPKTGTLPVMLYGVSGFAILLAGAYVLSSEQRKLRK